MQEENLISLLKETMKFYADPNNYAGDQIKNDGGHMARFVLDLIKKNEETVGKAEKEYEEIHNNVNKMMENTSPEEILDMLNKIAKQNGR